MYFYQQYFTQLFLEIFLLFECIIKRTNVSTQHIFVLSIFEK